MTLEMWHDEEGEKGQFKAPVITMVQGLGPAHKGYIASSQSIMARRGPFIMLQLLDVKTITGVVLGGEYHPVASIEEPTQAFVFTPGERDIPAREFRIDATDARGEKASMRFTVGVAPAP